jgi:EF-hand domain-containing protein 1
MERTRVLQPGSSLSDPAEPAFYDIKHLYVGSKIEILSRAFVLLDADEYVFNYMETDPARFKYSDVYQCREKILKLLKNMPGTQRDAIITALYNADANKTGTIERQALVTIAKANFPGILTDHVFTLNLRKSLHSQDNLRTKCENLIM